MLGTRGCGHPHCAGGCSPVPRGWGQDIPCRPPLHGRSPHLPHRPRIHPCARGSGSGPPSLGGQSSQGGRWVLCTGRNIQPGRIPEPRRGKAGPSLNAPIPPLCPNPGAAEPSMGLEPEPTTFLQTCLGVGFVSSRGLDEGWQDRRMDRMDRQTDGQQWCFSLEGEIQHQLPHLGRTGCCCQVCISLGELLRVLKVILKTGNCSHHWGPSQSESMSPVHRCSELGKDLIPNPFPAQFSTGSGACPWILPCLGIPKSPWEGLCSPSPASCSCQCSAQSLSPADPRWQIPVSQWPWGCPTPAPSSSHGAPLAAGARLDCGPGSHGDGQTDGGQGETQAGLGPPPSQLPPTGGAPGMASSLCPVRIPTGIQARGIRGADGRARTGRASTSPQLLLLPSPFPPSSASYWRGSNHLSPIFLPLTSIGKVQRK